LSNLINSQFCFDNMCLFILRTFAGSRKVVLEIQIGGSNLQKNKNFLNETTDFYVTLYVKLH